MTGRVRPLRSRADHPNTELCDSQDYKVTHPSFAKYSPEKNPLTQRAKAIHSVRWPKLESNPNNEIITEIFEVERLGYILNGTKIKHWIILFNFKIISTQVQAGTEPGQAQ